MKPARKLGQCLKWTAWFFVASGVIIGVAVMALLANPDWLVNEKMLRVLANLGRENKIVDIRWDQATAHVQSEFLKPQAFEFSFANLCVAGPSREEEVCWKNAFFSFKIGFSGKMAFLGNTRFSGNPSFFGNISFFGFRPIITEVGPVRLLSGELTLLPSKKSQSPEAPLRLDDLLTKVAAFISAANGISIRSIYVYVYHPKGKMVLKADGNKLDIISDLTLKQLSLGGGQFLNGGIKLSLISKKNHAQLNAKGLGRISGMALNQVKTFSASLEGEVLDLKNLDHIQIKLNGRGRGLFPKISELELRNCVAHIRKVKSNSFPGNIKLVCPGTVRLPLGLPAGLDDRRQWRLPQRGRFTVRSDFNSKEFPFAPASEVEGWAQLEIAPLSTPLFRGQGKVKMNFSGIPRIFPNQWKIDSDVAVGFRIRQFEALVKNFAKTPWAVPAPFHVLKGSVDLDVHGKSDLNRGSFPIHLKTRLRSEYQKLNLDGQGVIHVNNIQSVPRSAMDFDLSLSDVELELPKLDLADPPRVWPDPRFHLLEERQEERAEKGLENKLSDLGGFSRFDESAENVPKDLKEGFSYDLQVKTPSHHPIKILSNLAKTPIPIDVQLFIIRNYFEKGFIRIKDFPIKAFRRDASLDHFDVVLKSPLSESRVDGLIKVHYVDYTVSILITSTLDKPVIQLSSDPPLPEDKLVATLLFGQPIEELDAEQIQSVGSARAAIADAALGIASLYALASTPVQSVGYDSTHKLLTAKLRLGKGTSLNLGADTGGIEEIGIRKRLGSNWSISTDMTNSKTGDQNKSVSTFLEWRHRY